MVDASLAYAGNVRREVQEALPLIYRAFFDDILVLMASPERLGERVDAYATYHLAGIQAVLMS